MYDAFYDTVVKYENHSLSEKSLTREIESVIAALRSDIVKLLTMHRKGEYFLAKTYYTQTFSLRAKKINQFMDEKTYLLENAITDKKNQVRQIHIIGSIYTFIVMLAIGFVSFKHNRNISKSIADPIKNLLSGIASIAKGDYTNKVEISFNNEFSDLGDALNTMSDNILESQELLNQKHETMKEIAMRDQLTGLYNRHFLLQVSEQRISSWQRHGMNFCVMMLDIDHFKPINDKYGHQRGDEILQAIASTLQKSCRTEDTVARFGGEEFIILFSQCNIEMAGKKSEKIRHAIELLKPDDLFVSVSIGVAEVDENDEDFQSILERADKALYQAKNNGRNQVICAENGHKSEQRLSLV